VTRRLELEPAFDSPALRRALEQALAPGGLEALPVIADGRRSYVARLEVEGKRYVVKRYESPRGFLLRTFLMTSRAEREAGALALVASTGNPVVPVAWGEERSFGFIPRSWVVTTELSESFNLRKLKDLPKDERDRAVPQLLEGLPPRVAALHAASIFARNLHAKNVLLKPGTGTVALIDLPRAIRVASLGAEQRYYDLACLAKELRRTFTAEQWRAFFASYSRALGSADDEARALGRIQAHVDELSNETLFAGTLHRLRKSFKRTALGEAISGHRYER
jgi:tRNA A-37 threonylcarbamoyl transferase component Bud32